MYVAILANIDYPVSLIDKAVCVFNIFDDEDLQEVGLRNKKKRSRIVWAKESRGTA